MIHQDTGVIMTEILFVAVLIIFWEGWFKTLEFPKKRAIKGV